MSKKKPEKVKVDKPERNEDQEKFDFGETFQRAIIKMSIDNPQWYEQNIDHINPDYFEYTEDMYIQNIVNTFYKQHEVVPSFEVIKQIVKDSYEKGLQQNIIKELEVIKDMQVTASEREYMLTKLYKFSTTQIYKNSIVQGAEALDSGNVDDIPKIYENALRVSEKKFTEPTFYFNEEDVTRYDLKHIQESKIPTLFKTLDDKMRGGPTKKELAMLMAPPYVGKSAGLIQLGTNALFSGKNVLHITLEMSQETTETRYDMSLTGWTYDQIKANVKGFMKKRDEFKRLYRGTLVVQEFPARNLSVHDLKVFIRSLRRRYNFNPDVLILDYMDEMKRPPIKDVTYAVGEVCASLRGLATEEDILIWTASQVNRAGFSKLKIDLDDVADSWDKVKVSDVIIAMCQTQEEQQKNLMRWYILKNRNNKRFSKAITMETKFDIMRFKEATVKEV